MKFHLIAHLAPVFSRTRFAGIVATRDYSTYLPQKSAEDRATLLAIMIFVLLDVRISKPPPPLRYLG